MCLLKTHRKWKKRRRERIYEGPHIDGGTRISKDEGAPKEIKSNVIIDFSCIASTLSLIDEELNLPRGVYSFTAKRENDGAHCTVSCSVGTEAGKSQEKKRPLSVLDQIDNLFKKYNVAKQYGIYYKVSGLPSFYGLKIDVTYDSGENLYCYNNQDLIFSNDFIKELFQIFGVSSKNSI